MQNLEASLDFEDDIFNKAMNYLEKTHFRKLPVFLRLLTLPLWIFIGFLGVILEP